MNRLMFLLCERFIKVGAGAIGFLYCARVLGPDSLGVLSTGFAVGGIFTAISSFGMHTILVKELTNKRFRLELFLAAFIIRSGIALLLLFGASLVISNNVIFALAALGVARAPDVVRSWYESVERLHVLASIEVFFTILFLVILIACIYFRQSLEAVAVIYLIEAVTLSIAACTVWFLYIAKGEIQNLTLSFYPLVLSHMRELFSTSWPLVIASVSWLVYTRVDVLLITAFGESELVGIYSAATKLVDVYTIIPATVIAFIAPRLVKLHSSDINLYWERLQKITSILIALSVLFSLVVYFYSEELVSFLYGVEFHRAAGVLDIHVCTTVFLSFTLITGRHLVNEGQQRYIMFRHLVGLTLNIILSYFLFGMYGIEGVAVATLFSMFLSGFIIDAMHSETRKIFILKLRSLYLARLIK